MTALAVALVLGSAFFHALWNYIAKGATGGTPFVWLFSVIETAIFFPLIVIVLVTNPIELDTTDLIFILGSSILHIAYFVLLTNGYRVGDLSIVYPLSRSIGPLLATFGAIWLFGERPNLLALVGTFLICGGAFFLVGNPAKFRERNILPAVVFAFLTGLSIACYTLWDSYAVAVLLIPPLLYQFGIGLFRTVALTPLMIGRQHDIRLAWQRDRGKALVVAILGPLSYLLMLIALSFSPVSYVAPLRVVSTLMGVLMGTQLLGEGDSMRRLAASGAMVIGVLALSFG